MPEELRVLLDRYLEMRRVHRAAETTLRTYRTDLEALAQRLGQQGVQTLADLTTRHLRNALAEDHRTGLSPRTLHRRLSAWRGFLAWAEGPQSRLPSNARPPMGLARGLRAPRAGHPLPDSLSVEEAQQLLDRPRAEDWRQSRDLAMAELVYSCGLRLEEAIGLDLPLAGWRPDPERGLLHLQAAEVEVMGKGSRRRRVPIGGAALRALKGWLTWRGQVLMAVPVESRPEPAAALFINAHGQRLTGRSLARRLSLLAQTAGLSRPIHPHQLRHAFASHLLQSSGDLRAVQELLGHAQISTTQVYTHLDFQHLAAVYDNAHPRAQARLPSLPSDPSKESDA